MTAEGKDNREDVSVDLPQADWADILQALLALSSGAPISLNNPERATALRDRIVKQLP